MNAPQWDRVKLLFQEALERPPEERFAWLRSRCDGDRALETEVEALLANHERAGSFGVRPALELLGAISADSESKALDQELAPGTRLGVYEIVSRVGAGGMGEVYKARDTRLDRMVAIKVLPAHLAVDPDRYLRFEREARAVASLDHPHIGALYDVGEHQGRHFLVMQYLDGETLAAKLAKGPLPLDQALHYAIDIADALDHAHRRGIVHRDLKPRNVVLTKTGATLLDFGLAKWRTDGLIAAPHAMESMTEEGLMVGTPHYMAPEQVESKRVDARTDVFAFGVVVYEMLTGKKAFDGATTVSIIAAILQAQPPPLSVVRPGTPAALDHVVATCLAKDPDQRWQSAGDVARQLRWIRSARSDDVAIAHSNRSLFGRDWRTVAVATTLGIAAGLVGAMSIWSGAGAKSAGRQIPVMRSAVSLPNRAVFDGDLALSPDGTHLAYVLNGDSPKLYLHALDEFDPKVVAGIENPHGLFFSPNSQWLGFFDGGKLKKMAVTGGAAQTICEFPGLSGTWAPDDTIVFSPGKSGLFRVPASGGTPLVLTSLRSGEKGHRLPQFLPGGKNVLFTIVPGNIRSFDDAQIAVASVETGQIKVLSERGTNPRFLPTGHLLYLRGLSLVAVQFDPQRAELTGRPVAMIDGVSSRLDGGSVLATVADNGLLAYLRGTVFGSDNRVVWVDRHGRIEPLLDALGSYISVSLSPDGQTLAIAIMAANDQIWLYDLTRRTMTPLTFDWDNGTPIWSPDGKRIAFNANRGDGRHLYWQNRDGIGSIERLTGSSNRQGIGSWLPDGKGFAYVEESPTTGMDIWLLSLTPGRPIRPLIQAPFNQSFPTFSPDGRWLAYVSDETGQPEVFVQPYPGLDAKWHVSSGGGNFPKWGKHELYYRTGSKLMAVPFRTEPTFVPAAPRMLFAGDFEGSYDIAPDGRFIMIQIAPDVVPAREITLVHNWFTELQQRVPTR